MKPESKQTFRNKTDKSSASCYDFTKLSEALESTQQNNSGGFIATVADSGAVRSDSKSLYELKEMSQALNHVEKNLKKVKRSLKPKKRCKKLMNRKQSINIQAFEDFEKLNPIAYLLFQERPFTILSVVY
ncbi:hypothetical protein SLEP1_g23968 [Rubroshorea leprosula]|uniref:Uncharacterized protein n=1 Tax=Rubroshorea leprosula TaxID=152421 RepID=A0AAV5JE41_9ROSI|nr:hypothetical protein SLEP1_g23968 [Rubroshorea leprosula]